MKFDYFDLVVIQAISTVLAVIQLGDPDTKWRSRLLKVFKAIAATYQTDPEFFKVAKTMKG